jgi:diguanylate cyclase (GGDEF)-like protein
VDTDAAIPRRKLATAAAAAAAFLAAALGFWLLAGAPAPGLAAVWLTLLCVLLGRVEFRVGQGVSTPVMLAIVQMLVLVPAPAIPLLVGGAHVIIRLPEALRGRRRRHLLLMPLADSWFIVAPAVLLALAPKPSGLEAEALLAGAAFLALCVTDLMSWMAITTVETGAVPRKDLRALAWTYAFDAMLLPIAFATALAAREVALAPAAILPLAALLAFFAHERSNRAAQAATLQTILQHASDVILIVSRDGRLRSVMGSAADLLGEASPEGTLLERVHPDDVALVTTWLARAPGEAEFRLLHDGRHVAGVAADLTADPHVRGLVLTVRDDESRQHLRHRASHDPLTGLANRALFHERLEAALARGEVAVLYVDLNEFKPINDTLGHAAGDEVLRIVARRLAACVRETDTVARLGGDEFALLLATPDHADEVAERVHAAFADPLQVGERALHVGASVGLAAGGGDVATLLDAADRAMYEVKRLRGARR